MGYNTRNIGYQGIGGEQIDVIVGDAVTGVTEYRLTANLADALSFEDSAGDILTMATTTDMKRSAFTGALTVTPTQSLTAATSLTYKGVSVPATTLTLTGTTQVTTATGLNLCEIAAPTYTDSSAVTVDLAATLYVGGPPVAGGMVTLSAPYALWVDSGVTRLDGTCYIGDNSNANVTLGLTINQGAADDIALCLKSSDVATVLTTIVTGTVETDDYFTVSKFAAATGGALIQALGNNAAVTTNLRIESYGGQPHATHTTAGRSLIEVAAAQHDGANGLSDITADSNVFGIRARVGASEVTVWLIDEDGAPQSVIDHAAFDEHDDISLVRNFDLSRSNEGYGLVKSKWDGYLTANQDKLVEIGVLGCRMDHPTERPLINLKRLAMLQNGCLWQLFEDVMEVVSALPEEIRSRIGGRLGKRLEAIPA